VTLGIAKIVEAFFWRKVIEGNSDCVPECIDGSGCHFGQCAFELGEDLFDRIEVRAVSWQEAHCCTRGFYNFPNADAFMGSQFVYQHNFSGRLSRMSALFSEDWATKSNGSESDVRRI
jgi:hypothetical protein